MSASDTSTAIYVTDTPKEIKTKINKYAFSGGGDTVEKHRKYGANLEVDIPVKYLSFFLDEDAELENIKEGPFVCYFERWNWNPDSPLQEYGAGRMLTGEVKQRLIEVLTNLVVRHQKLRSGVTEEMVDAFMAVRPLPNMYG